MKKINFKKALILCFCICFCTNFTQKMLAQVVCTERMPTSGDGVKTKTAGQTAKFWKAGQTITIKFLAGSPFVREKVKQYASEWLKYANLKFEFVADDAPAMIRIDFKQGGSYSYLGTDNTLIPATDHTMNYGWLTDQSAEQEFSRVVVHEFGHMLGLIHEQAHPDVDIPWDKEKVYAYYAKQGWDKTQVDNQVFYRYSHEVTQYSAYDKLSIMHYAVPKEHTIGGFEIKWNTALSETDKAFIARIYPKGNTPTVTNPTTGGGTTGGNGGTTASGEILPRNLATGWYGIPFPKLDATVNYPNGQTYMFYGSEYIRWDYNEEAYLTPKSISEDWKGVNFTKIDAAVYWESTQKIYFFSGDEYVRYDIAEEKVDRGFPMKIKSGWAGMEEFGKIDAAFPWKDKVYFFSGNKYVRFSFTDNRIDEGYPKTINKTTWKGVNFDKIDAALVWKSPIVYFFKGNQYYRFDMNKDSTF